MGDVVPVAVIADPEAGVAVTVYPVIGVPPSDTGAVKETSVELDSDPVKVEVTLVGEPGKSATTIERALEAAETFPAASVATAVIARVPTVKAPDVHEKLPPVATHVEPEETPSTKS